MKLLSFLLPLFLAFLFFIFGSKIFAKFIIILNEAIYEFINKF